MIDFFFNTVRFYTSGIEPFFTAHRRTDGYEFFLNYIQVYRYPRNSGYDNDP